MNIVNDNNKLQDAVINLVTESQGQRIGRDSTLYSISGGYLAVGSLADRLYMLYGWEISEMDAGTGERVPYIIITDDGRDFLKAKGHNFHISLYDDKLTVNKMDIAGVQQFLDMLRTEIPDNESRIEHPVIRQSVTIDMGEFIREGRLSMLAISKDSIEVTIDNEDKIILADRNGWNVNSTTLGIYESLSKVITQQHQYLHTVANDYKKALKVQRDINMAAYGIYTIKKAQYKKEIVLLKGNGFFITYDDDAILLSEKIPLRLYDSQAGNRTHTAFILSPVEFSSLSDLGFSIQLIHDATSHKSYEFGFRDSILNYQIKEAFSFSGIAIYKRSTGDYVIKASTEGKELPETVIPSYIGNYYQRLPIGSLERQKLLSVIAHRTYDKSLSILSDNQQRGGRYEMAAG